MERIGVHDNFFDLGGHSLLATQIISRVREVFLLDVGLREFLDNPTLAGLAECIEVHLLESDKRRSDLDGGPEEREQIKL